MNGREMSAALRAGRRVYGTLITSPSPHLPGPLSRCGLDYVFIDTEHVPINDHDLAWMCQTYRAMNLAPIVRIPSPDPNQATHVLDVGASGVVAPYVETVQQVRDLRGAVKLRPLKGKKLAGLLDGSAIPGDDAMKLIRERNQDNVLIFNVESVPAMKNLDKLLEVPDVDAVQIGPHDLSFSLEVPENYKHPEFDKAVRFIIKTARDKGVGAGIHFWESLDQEIDWAKFGGNLFLHSADVLLFTKALRKDLQDARRALGDAFEEGDAKGDAI